MDSSAERQREYRERMRRRGLVKREVWVPARYAAHVKTIETALRQGIVPIIPSGRSKDMAEDTAWTTRRLYEALSRTPHVEDGTFELELIEGADPAIAVRIPSRLDDLPILVTASGSQILAEALVWPVEQVAPERRAELNETLLSVQKLFPLSSFGLESGPDGARYYTLHGELSAQAAFDDVLLEIETLADNILSALDLFERFAKTAA